jgi:hypothetical protein
VTSRDRTVAAALAITFDDRATRRHLALKYPLDLDRARLALDIADRRERRRAVEEAQPSDPGDGPEAA